MWETWVQSLGWEDPLEKGKATHSSILAWRILWTTVHGVTKSQTQLSNFHFHGSWLLPRSKCLLILCLPSLSTVILEPKKIKSATVSTCSPSICHEVMGLDAMILVFWMLSFKSVFSLSLSHSSRGSLVPVHFLPLERYHQQKSPVFSKSVFWQLHNLSLCLFFIRSEWEHTFSYFVELYCFLKWGWCLGFPPSNGENFVLIDIIPQVLLESGDLFPHQCPKP